MSAWIRGPAKARTMVGRASSEGALIRISSDGHAVVRVFGKSNDILRLLGLVSGRKISINGPIGLCAEMRLSGPFDRQGLSLAALPFEEKVMAESAQLLAIVRLVIQAHGKDPHGLALRDGVDRESFFAFRSHAGCSELCHQASTLN